MDNKKENKNIQIANKIAIAVKEAGGRTFFVGGCVRDEVMGIESKDVDIEVHEVPVQKLKEILSGFGVLMNVGVTFGIFRLHGYDMDISLPRNGKTTEFGKSYVEIYTDPYIGTKNAARYRDFTINAMMKDVLTGEILDYFGGREDINNRIIRYTEKSTFALDSLRVFRAAQFSSRFGFEIAKETLSFCSEIDISDLPCERIMGELEKALLKSARPSVFFDSLRKMNQLSVWFPEVEALGDIEQDKTHHPEGNVWNHTMQVLDVAAELRDYASNPLWFMMAALCHDFGKAVSSENLNGRIHAYGHEKSGLPIVKSFLERLTGDLKLQKYVLNMTEYHMKPCCLIKNESHIDAYMKMYDDSVCPEDLLLLAKADHIGRAFSKEEKELLETIYESISNSLQEKLSVYRVRMSQPYLTGNDLIEAGFQPGKRMGEILQYAHKIRLSGGTKEEQYKNAVAMFREEK